MRLEDMTTKDIDEMVAKLKRLAIRQKHQAKRLERRMEKLRAQTSACQEKSDAIRSHLQSLIGFREVLNGAPPDVRALREHVRQMLDELKMPGLPPARRQSLLTDVKVLLAQLQSRCNHDFVIGHASFENDGDDLVGSMRACCVCGLHEYGDSKERGFDRLNDAQGRHVAIFVRRAFTSGLLENFAARLPTEREMLSVFANPQTLKNIVKLIDEIRT